MTLGAHKKIEILRNLLIVAIVLTVFSFAGLYATNSIHILDQLRFDIQTQSRFLRFMWHEFRLDNLLELFAFFSILSVYPSYLLTNFFHRKFLINEEKEERHLRGAKLITAQELNKIIKKF